MTSERVIHLIERVVDTREYVSVLREIAEEGKVVSLRIAGSSMSPFLAHGRDYIYFTRPDRELRRGDMVFYQRRNGQYVMHRIWKKKEDGYYIVGDAQTDIEGPVLREQIFARIIKVKRKGKILEPGDFWWDFFEKVWIRLVPVRRPAVALYSVFYRIRHGVPAPGDAEEDAGKAGPGAEPGASEEDAGKAGPGAEPGAAWKDRPDRYL